MKKQLVRARFVVGIIIIGPLFLGLLACGSTENSDKTTSVNDPQATAGSAKNVDSPYPDNTYEYLAGPLQQSNMEATSYSGKKNKTYMLPATPATTQWGVFDNSVPPALRINSGDTVAIETMTAAGGQVAPGITAKQIEKLNTAVKNRGPHTVTGPIYVNGAEPGDVVAIHINKIVTRAYATNNSTTTGGLFPDKFPPEVDSYYLDTEKMETKFNSNITVPLEPFPGILAVGRPDSESVGPFCTDHSCDTVPPGDYGGNLDLREMKEGTTTYLPVGVKGALIWTGDSHAAQGNGEIDLDALETAFPELNVTIKLIKDQPQVKWPVVESTDTWISVGYDKDLDVALDMLKTETVRLIMEKRHLSRKQATDAMYKTWNCPISEVVDKVFGAYCMIPKDPNAPKAGDIPKQDTSEYWVTYAKNADLMSAMKTAAFDSLEKMSEKMNITTNKAYRLATFVQDCRIGRYEGGEKEVACLVPKSIYTR